MAGDGNAKQRSRADDARGHVVIRSEDRGGGTFSSSNRRPATSPLPKELSPCSTNASSRLRRLPSVRRRSPGTAAYGLVLRVPLMNAMRGAERGEVAGHLALISRSLVPTEYWSPPAVRATT